MNYTSYNFDYNSFITPIMKCDYIKSNIKLGYFNVPSAGQLRISKDKRCHAILTLFVSRPDMFKPILEVKVFRRIIENIAYDGNQKIIIELKNQKNFEFCLKKEEEFLFVKEILNNAKNDPKGYKLREKIKRKAKKIIDVQTDDDKKIKLMQLFISNENICAILDKNEKIKKDMLLEIDNYLSSDFILSDLNLIKNFFEKDAFEIISDKLLLNINEIKKEMLKRNYEMDIVESDGACLFRALSMQINENQDHHLEYRNKVCQYLKNNKEKYSPFLISILNDADDMPNVENYQTEEEKFEYYIKEMEKPNTYGDALCILAFCEIFEVKVKVIQTLQKDFIFNEETNYNKILNLYFCSRTKHYNSLRKIK